VVEAHTRTAVVACMLYGITRSYLPPGSISRPYPTVYSIYPPVKDERLSRPQPTQVKDFPGVATEVLAMPSVSWLIRPSAPVGTVGVNNLLTVVISDWLQWTMSFKHELNMLSTRPPRRPVWSRGIFGSTVLLPTAASIFRLVRRSELHYLHGLVAVINCPFV